MIISGICTYGAIALWVPKKTVRSGYRSGIASQRLTEVALGYGNYIMLKRGSHARFCASWAKTACDSPCTPDSAKTLSANMEKSDDMQMVSRNALTSLRFSVSSDYYGWAVPSLSR